MLWFLCEELEKKIRSDKVEQTNEGIYSTFSKFCCSPKISSFQIWTKKMRSKQQANEEDICGATVYAARATLNKCSQGIHTNNHICNNHKEKKKKCSSSILFLFNLCLQTQSSEKI